MRRIDTQTEHMKHRCYGISAICGLSLYCWFNYPIVEPINNSIATPYYQNCILLLVYIGWDMYHMMRQPTLFRTDLMIHHLITFVAGLSFINNMALQSSNYSISECISLMNYVWRNKRGWLKLYRTACILCIRMPISLYMLLYSNQAVYGPYWKRTRTHSHYIYLSTLSIHEHKHFFHCL
jgi:hypothetical protein